MLFGHKDKIKLFKKIVREDNLGHAFLFFGDAQIGKFLFAKCFTNYLENGEFEEPATTLIDALIVNPEEKGTIGIDESREIKSFLSETPLKSPKRTVVINEAHRLTPEAQSALLKITEEPFRCTLLLLVSERPTMLAPPLLSRLTKVYFRRFAEEDLIRILVSDFNVGAEKAKKAARISLGRLGRAILFARGARKPEEAENLAGWLQNELLRLYFDGPDRNSLKLSFLLARESEVNRYNLNERIQKKAIKGLV